VKSKRSKEKEKLGGKMKHDEGINKIGRYYCLITRLESFGGEGYVVITGQKRY
jgi:hypothetical protein